MYFAHGTDISFEEARGYIVPYNLNCVSPKDIL